MIMASTTPGERLRTSLWEARKQQFTLPFVGIYDAFSASLVANQFEALFLSGFGLAASTYGLPDIGFIGWAELTTTTARLRSLLPNHHLLIDIDDGFGDATVASHVAISLERCGASGVVLEDQARPRRCGHFNGKHLLALSDYVAKLEAVVQNRSSMVVVARTDASNPEEILLRVRAYENAGCDAVLADGIKDINLIKQLRKSVHCPMFCNVIGGGKIPQGSRADLALHGVEGLIYSTPCLFAAQSAIEETLGRLTRDDMPLADALVSTSDLSHCHAVLEANLERASAK